jgi:hypothetical protein
MVHYRQIFRWIFCLAGLLAAASAQAGDNESLAGPAYAKFRLTLDSGWREEAAGPFFYRQSANGQNQWALPPFFCRTSTPQVDWEEWEIFYPIIDYRRFGREYKLEIGELLSFSGGHTQDSNAVRRTTLFPLYFRQRSTDTNDNYTALVPIYGHLRNRMFRDEIKFFLFPLYSETRKKGVVVDNYIYPIFDRRRGAGVSGWEVWPLGGEARKIATFQTNSMHEVSTNGGYDHVFALWPFYFKDRAGLGTTNPASSLTVVPFYSQTRSPSRDESSYGFPFGFNAIHDREQGYVEHDFLWPLFEKAHGSKTVTRYFPFYSRALHNGMESVFYGFLLYKFNRLQAAPLDRRRTRILYFLYSDTVERNTQSREFKRRVDFWPFYSYERKLDGTRRTQLLAVLEPLFPNNRTIAREYSPVWALWRAEKNPRTGATSQSLLWNLYRHEKAGRTKKASLLFGLIQYQCTPDGSRWRVCHLNLGGKPAQATVAKS